MMTKDEAKGLTRYEVYRRLDIYDSMDIEQIIQQNWPQISKQLDKWFGYIEWNEDKEFVSDPIGWMLRAYIASEEK